MEIDESSRDAGICDDAPVVYKAADVIGGGRADNIGGFMEEKRMIANGNLETTT